jgi:hypothetical protein
VEVGAGDEVVVDGDGDDAVGGGHIGVVLDRIYRISKGLTGFFEWGRDGLGQDCCASLPFGLPLAGCLPSVG